MRVTLVAGALLLVTAGVHGQSWQLRLDASAQRVSYIGIRADSVLASESVTGPTGGPVTTDGFAVSCFGGEYCYHFRPGPELSGTPTSASIDLSMWGLGLRGLRIKARGRGLTDLTGDRLWPGTSPALRLVEGYAEYFRDALVLRAGRILDEGRLGNSGFGAIDGARASWLFDGSGVEVGGYAGWGLARGTVLPVTSPAVNPLLDFQPRNRQHVFGGFVSARLPFLDAKLEYRREIDPETDYFVSERAGASFQLLGLGPLRFASGFDVDLAQGHLGNAEAAVTYSRPGVSLTVGGRQYRPFFDLWTVWGAFSPVAHRGIEGRLSFDIGSLLQVRGRADWFRYDDAEASTPTVQVEDDGRRAGVGLSIRPSSELTAELDWHTEFTPGAASRGVAGRVAWQLDDRLRLGLEGGSLERPLEFRFQDAGVRWVGASTSFRAGAGWEMGFTVDRYWESRDRPDAAAFDWNQWRFGARLSLLLRSEPDRWSLPPAVRTTP